MGILSDNGKEFNNKLLSEICELFQVDKFQTTVYKPSTNGLVERWHRTLNAMLAKVVSLRIRKIGMYISHMCFVLIGPLGTKAQVSVLTT